MTTATNTVVAVSKSDVLAAVSVFVADNKRPCPSHFLTEKFGIDVLDVVDELKGSGVLLGLRGRNGGLALPGSDIVLKRSEHAAKKAKAAVEVGAAEQIESAEQAVSSVA